MIQLGLEKGLASIEAVRCSQELDQLLNLYQEVSVQKVAEVFGQPFKVYGTAVTAKLK